MYSNLQTFDTIFKPLENVKVLKTPFISNSYKSHLKRLKFKMRREIHAVLANSAYKTTDEGRINEVKKYYGDRFEYLPEYSDGIHAVYRDSETDKIIMSIAGTDFDNKSGRSKKDLQADAILAIGGDIGSDRFEVSDKKLKTLIGEFGGDNITVAGHSLGAAVGYTIGLMNGVEVFGYNRGGSPLSFQSTKILPNKNTLRERGKKIHLFFSQPELNSIDVLSVGTSFNEPYANVQFVNQKDLPEGEGGIIPAHSTLHFYPDEEF